MYARWIEILGANSRQGPQDGMLGSTVVADIHLHVAHFAHHAVRVWAGEHVDALAMRQHVRVGAIRRRGDVNVLIGGKDRREKEDEEGQRQDFHGRSSHRCVGTVQGCLSERGRASEEGGREEGKVIVGQWGSGAVGLGQSSWCAAAAHTSPLPPSRRGNGRNHARAVEQTRGGDDDQHRGECCPHLQRPEPLLTFAVFGAWRRKHHGFVFVA